MRIVPNEVQGLGRFAATGIKMRLKWGTVDEPVIGNYHAVDFENRVASAPVVPDGQWHEYETDLSNVYDWSGDVNELWFEAVNAAAANVDIDWMRFE